MPRPDCKTQCQRSGRSGGRKGKDVPGVPNSCIKGECVCFFVVYYYMSNCPHLLFKNSHTSLFFHPQHPQMIVFRCSEERSSPHVS